MPQIPPSRSVPQQTAPKSKPVLWGALAAGTWKEADGSGWVHVGGALNHRTEAEATTVALNNCQADGGKNCHPVGKPFTGCGYISAGKGGKLEGKVGWGSGGRPSEALRECRSKELICNEPIGGCNETIRSVPRGGADCVCAPRAGLSDIPFRRA
jgi:hypothetical protein